MDKAFGHCNITSPKNGTSFWRKVELTDLPSLKAMISTENRCQVFAGFSDDIARLITENPLSLCQVCSENVISMFISLCDRPNITCVAYEQWTEWFNYFYDLADVEEYNTLFIHALLSRRGESLVGLPAMFEMIYVQIPEIRNVILVKIPGMKIAVEICSLFISLPAKNVMEDPEYGRPEILYHTRTSSINEIHLRAAIILYDFINLRESLGDRLAFLNACYGENSLAKILTYPGDDHFNLVTATAKVNGLCTISTSVNYALLSSVFDLHEYEGLVVSRDSKMELNKTPVPDDRTETTENTETPLGSRISAEDIRNDLMLSNPYSKRLLDRMENDNKHTLHSNTIQENSFPSTSTSSIPYELRSVVTLARENDSESIFQKKPGNIVTNFLKSQDKTSLYSKSEKQLIVNTKIIYEKTSFKIELMLMDEEEENKASRDFFLAYFHEFPQYDYCLVTLSTIVTPPEFKKFFCKVFLKPNHYKFTSQLYILHRLSLFGNFNCVMVTKDNLKIVEDLIKNHIFEQVILDNISKSVFKDTRYKTYIFQCDNQPIGYCVIRLSDEITFLSRNFEVSRYVYPEQARNHAAVLLNMDIKTIFLKKTRCLLKYIMQANDINCLFYKLYSHSTVMEQNKSSFISGIDELIPVKPRLRMQYDDEDLSGNNFEKFALFHMNTRLCTTQKLSLDVKIVVVGASTVALSFLESLLFNPVNCFVRFENIVLISDDGMPYRVGLTELENCLVPRVTHYNHEYLKSIALNSFVDVITGTVTEISRTEKYVKVNGGVPTVYYDYLFLFNGEQFTHNIEDAETKSEKRKNKNHPSCNFTPCRRLDGENVLPGNFFLLNSDHDIVHACNYINTMKSNDKSIIVYGKYLGSLSVINVLLESNINGRRIVYIESDDRENLPFVDSDIIKRTVYKELSRHGVSVYKGFNFESLILNHDQMIIQKASFGSAVDSITVECAGLFWFDQKSVVKTNWSILYTFQSDGHLVISKSFETVDECVYAAGPVARFNDSKDDASSVVHYNSSEIGARVADVFMRRLRVRDDVGGGTNHPATGAAELGRPLSVYCRLPGRYHYLHCAVPQAVYAQKSLYVLKTGNVATAGPYFEIMVDDNGDVMKMSCYSKTDFKYLNLINLCGKNVFLFNDMVNRWRTDSIQCFFEYFNEPWAYPLYSDRFPKILDDVMKLLTNTNDKFTGKFSDEDDVDAQIPEIYPVCDLSTLVSIDAKEWEKVLINFIDENVDDFPEFSHVRDAVDRINSA